MPAFSNHLSPSTELGRLLAGSAEEQQKAGYADTLHEILQQPQTWQGTAGLLAGPAVVALLPQALISRPEHIVLTGSGSSVHVGECLAGVLQAALRIPCRAIPAGDLLTHARGMLASGRGLIISIARSGDSPESAAVADSILVSPPACTH